MHFTKAKGILSSKNGMNLFRGCTHGCIYCDSRSKCYQRNHKFEDVEVKENGISLLEESLKRKRKKCMIGLGSMTDPYIKEELGLNYTRQALEIVNKYGFGITLITKSANVLRDLDLLKEKDSLYSQIIDLRKEVEQAEKVKICIETLHTQKKELTQSKSKDLGL